MPALGVPVMRGMLHESAEEQGGEPAQGAREGAE